MDLTALQSLLGLITQARVACVGDVMVDRFVYGEVGRTSPEAPVAVLARVREASMLGGAGNVARNVAALGGIAALAGVLGEDPAGSDALRMLESEGRMEGHLVSVPGRPTTVKTRYVAGGQQLLRVDAEEIGALPWAFADKMVNSVRHAARDAGAILLSDYGKGAVSDAVIAACLEAARLSGAPLIVDSKARGLHRYGNAALLKPNAAELAHVTDMPTDTDAQVEAALAHALTLCDVGGILVTRAARGMSLLQRGSVVRHFRGSAREVFDVSGAGDTALAALGLALAAGAAYGDAVELALLASGVAVSKAGTAVVSSEELIEAEVAARLAPAEAKIASFERAARLAVAWRAQGLKVGFTNGCFDILHRGHISYLVQARGWCDRLIVGINSDASVKRLKGDSRPVNDLDSRAVVLGGLSHVDLVAPFSEDTPLALIEAVRPDVLIKGADYTEATVVGAKEVRSWGGIVQLAPLVEGYSTSAAIERMAKLDANR